MLCVSGSGNSPVDPAPAITLPPLQGEKTNSLYQHVDPGKGYQSTDGLDCIIPGSLIPDSLVYQLYHEAVFVDNACFRSNLSTWRTMMEGQGTLHPSPKF